MKTRIWVVFWVFAYLVLIRIFSSSSETLPVDHIYTAIFIGTLMIAVHLNEYSRKRFLSNGRPNIWFFTVLAIVLGAAAFNDLLFSKVIDFILPGYYFISYYSYLDLLRFFAAFVTLSTLIGLSMEWFDLQKEKETITTGRISNLVNQINPHFLFNSLTVLYTLSLKDSKETSSAIIKLSDILRYVIYGSTEKGVKLSSDAGIIRDYIDLQRHRVHPSTRIEFVDNISQDVSVSPMLFLPLVENAFKHGVHGETEKAFVSIALREENGVVNFRIRNNKGNVKTSPGIGLKNLKERLNLLYPNKHSFIITETENEFNVEMRLHDR